MTTKIDNFRFSVSRDRSEQISRQFLWTSSWISDIKLGSSITNFSPVGRIERRYDRQQDKPQTPEYNRIFRQMFSMLSESIDQHRPARCEQLTATSTGHSIPSLTPTSSLSNLARMSSPATTPTTAEMPKHLPHSARLFSKNSVG